MKRNNRNPRNTLSDRYRISMNKRIGRRLRAIRDKHNGKYPDNFISQDTLAHAIGIKVAAMNQAECGAVGVQMPTLEAIADYWDMSLDEMLEGIEAPTIEMVLGSKKRKEKVTNE